MLEEERPYGLQLRRGVVRNPKRHGFNHSLHLGGNNGAVLHSAH